ncbi:DUF637 domain-containing protein [Pseudoalteromonas sp. McH1-42]|uniref:DUF637 domain-containing protein n=1 Tax=Pseudoalteromonas sp. McH1-42 TaxID=2917752 RepID=UPI001EF403FF|nr:DUF637 domain-containing protein [Pseudoalteromonas sp. McH1-42]MCG7564579.1 DUF637 domain-containing protein [Pseudoalteromonas sp. McH1-42]
MKKNNLLVDKPVPFYKKAIAYVNIIMLLGQMSLPTLAYAYNAFDKINASQSLSGSPEFTKVPGSKTTQYVKSEHIVEQARPKTAHTIASFHQLLLNNKKQALPAPQYIPIMNGEVQIIFPHYPLAKQVGDRFVQSRLIRSQIYAELNRNLISPAYADETAQINQLYQNAYELAGKINVTFGEKITKSEYDRFGKDFVWPEFREINGEKVLSPVVHLSDKTIETRTVNGHIVEFTGSDVNFRDITVNSGTLLTGRNTYLRTARDLTVNPGAEVASDGDLNLFVGGTLRNLSGSLTAQQNVDIIAGQYIQKTLVHRFSNRYERGSRFGQIASVNGDNIRIHSMGDILVQGGTITGNTIGLRADGNIRLISQQTSYVNNQPVGEYSQSTSEIKHLTTKLSAKDSIYLMAAGAIELKAAELYADEGVIELLAGQGIFISNEFNQFQKQSNAKWGKTTEEEQEFQTIAIRSALEAGKGVMIASDFGDITLQATQITSGTGTTIDARNGRVNLLLAKEQDHYFYNKVKKGTWKIKTETIQDTVDTAVYNEIIGGVKVHATHGVTLELGQYEGETLQDTLNTFSGNESLSWMADIYNDPQYNCPSMSLPQAPDGYRDFAYEAMQQDPAFNNCSSMLDVIYTKLEEIHKHDKTSSLSPAAMAVIAIAVSVAMGPAGANWIGANGKIALAVGKGTFSAAALSAGAATLTTQAVSSLANGEGIDGAIKSITESDNLRSLAIAMVTAGMVQEVGAIDFFEVDPNAAFLSSDTLLSIGNQSIQAVVDSTIRAGVSTAINGGSFSDFEDSFKTSMKMFAVSELGEFMAGKIGAAFDGPNATDTDTALKYIAHAASGCIIGAATAQVNGNRESKNISCGAGAGGAVLGEYIASSMEDSDTYVAARQKAKEEYQAFFDKNKAQIAVWKAKGLSAEQIEYNLNQGTSRLAAVAEMQRLKDAGVDLVKLSAAVTAFVAGADASAINIAGNAAATSAEFNTFSDYTIGRFMQSLLADYLEGLRSDPNGVLGVELGKAADNVYQWSLNQDVANNAKLQLLYSMFPEDVKSRLNSKAVSQADRLTIAAAVLAGIIDAGSGVATAGEAVIRVGMTMAGDSQAGDQNIQLVENSIEDIKYIFDNYEEIFDKVINIIDTADTDRESKALIARFTAASATTGIAGYMTAGAASVSVTSKLAAMLKRLQEKGVDISGLKKVTGIDGFEQVDTNGDGIADSITIKPLPAESFPNDLISKFAAAENKSFEQMERQMQRLKDGKGADFEKLISTYLKEKNVHGLTAQDANVIFGYSTGWFYHKLNSALRDGTVNSAQKDITRMLDTALDKLPSVDGNFVRGLNFSNEADLQATINRYISAWTSGKTVVEGQFNSVSRGDTPLQNFDGQIIMHIESKSAKDISDLAMDVQFWHQLKEQPVYSEFLIKSGGQFTVIDIDKNGAVTHIYMKQVD